MVMLSSSRYVEYAAQGLTPKQVMALTGCPRKQAKQALSRAHEVLSENVEAAVALLERSALATAQLAGGVSGEALMAKRKWEDVALGLLPA